MYYLSISLTLHVQLVFIFFILFLTWIYSTWDISVDSDARWGLTIMILELFGHISWSHTFCYAPKRPNHLHQSTAPGLMGWPNGSEAYSRTEQSLSGGIHLVESTSDSEWGWTFKAFSLWCVQMQIFCLALVVGTILRSKHQRKPGICLCCVNSPRAPDGQE